MAVLVACGQDSSVSLRSLWALQDIYHSFSYVLNAGGVLSQCDARFQMSGTSLDKNVASGESTGRGST